MEPETRFLSRDGSRFRVLRWSSTQNPRKLPILLLHGFTQSARSFQEVAENLLNAHGFDEIFAMDQRGHGESSWTSDYSRKAMVEDLNFVTKQLFPNQTPYVLGGMSMGGGVSAAFCSNLNDSNSKPSKLVLIDWAPWSEKAPPAGVSKIVKVFDAEWASFDDAVEQMCAFNTRRSRENIRSRLSHQLRFDESSRTFKWNTDPRIRTSAILKAKEPPSVMWDAIGNIRIPTLLLRGSKSDVLDHDRAFRLIHHALPNETPGRLVVVEGAGHSVMGDKPVESAAAVADWLLTHKL